MAQNLCACPKSPPAALPSPPLNQWKDSFIQSMETPYASSVYSVHVEKLVSNVKIMFNEMKNVEGDLICRLQMVDAIQFLGIDRHFEKEIKTALDYVYRYWNKTVGIGLGRESVATDLNATAIGLRLLRVNRYNISPDVLNNFKDEYGRFFCCERDKSNNNIAEDHKMRSMLNLLRASSIIFPRENILEEANAFATTYLKNLLAKHKNTSIISKRDQSFVNQVEYALAYPWFCSLPRWEARNFIEIYGQDDSRLNNLEILKLAKMDFNVLQSVHQMEMKELSRWWEDSRMEKLMNARVRTMECYLWIAGGSYEVEFCRSRMAFVKIAMVATVLDDIYDEYGTLEQLKLITEAIVQGWDVSTIQSLPNNYKEVLQFLSKTVHEMTKEATEIQGRDMFPFIKKAWADYVNASLQQSEWKVMQYVPNFQEYIRNGIIRSGTLPILLHSMLLMGPIFADDIFREQLLPSRFYELIHVCGRLIDDAMDFEEAKLNGQPAPAISSYLKDHPDSTEEAALSYINNIIDVSLKELNFEFLKSDDNHMKFCFNYSRGIQFVYRLGDGLTYPDKEMKDYVFKTLIEPVQI